MLILILLNDKILTTHQILMKQLPGQQRDTLTQHNMQHVKRHTYKKKKKSALTLIHAHPFLKKILQ